MNTISPGEFHQTLGCSRMERHSANNGVGRKLATTVPPIMIHSGTPCPPSPSDCRVNESHSRQQLNSEQQLTTLNGKQQYDSQHLPQLSMHRSVMGGGQSPFHVASSPWNHPQLQTNTFKHPSEIFANMKQEADPSGVSYTRKDVPNTLQLQKSQTRILNRLSHGGQADINHLQPPHQCGVSNSQVHSPTFSDVSSIRLTPQAQARQNSRSQKAHLPQVYGYLSNSVDLDDAASPVIPPLTSLSPYLGSGISEVPSFPSILSPQSSSHHLSRKRALSVSPFSDLLDVSGIRSSPNSLYVAMFGSHPMTPNGQAVNGEPFPGSVGHLVGHANPVPPNVQYRVQNRKTSIEHNQNVDGTMDTTITNQVTFTEQRHRQNLARYNAQGIQPHSNLSVHQVAAQTMEDDYMSSRGSITSHTNSTHSSQLKDEFEPYVCLWDSCNRIFDEQEYLVHHIENLHIEKGKLDNFTCLWKSCIRNKKPFNARYKLIIHMRIHSGEKPNKCTVSCFFCMCSYNSVNVKVMISVNVNIMVRLVLVLTLRLWQC